MLSEVIYTQFYRDDDILYKSKIAEDCKKAPSSKKEFFKWLLLLLTHQHFGNSKKLGQKLWQRWSAHAESI